MSETRKKTGSGAELVIQVADYESGMALHDAFLAKLSTLKADINFSAFSNVKSLTELKELDVGLILNLGVREILPALASFAADKNIREAAFVCLARATYNGQRITPALFNDVEARKDFYEIILECLKVNVLPFAGTLVSLLSTLQPPKITATQK